MKKSHTTLDDNDKVETKKKYLLRYQSQQHEKSSRVEIEKKKGTGLKKVILQIKSRNIILHPLPKFVGLSIVKKKM